ncbi:MAG: hypothetical protein ACLTCB_06180 [Merdibacter sp.]
MPGVSSSGAGADRLRALPPVRKQRKAGRVAGINKMRFRRPVIPGDVMRLEVKLTNQRAGIYFADVCASVDGEVAARGEIMCALSDAK